MDVKILSKDKIYTSISSRIANLVNSKSNAILGLATGGTALGVYEQLVKDYKAGKLSFKNVKTFNLDEYLPIEPTNPQSYRFYMNHNLFNNIDIDLNNTFFPSLDNYQQYDELIAKQNGIDLQILGLGSNGHIAFNEPGTDFNSLTHIVQLAQSTIKDNSRFFDSIDLVPKQAITMGLKSIMNTKEIILIATGKNKAPAIKKLMEEEPNEQLPVSILKNHPNVTIYLDEEAASLLC